MTQADRQEGRREKKGDALGTAERDELARLRRENKQLRLERDILSRAATWFARETGVGMLERSHWWPRLTVGVPDKADLPMTDLAQFGGTLECLAKEPDLYTDADAIEQLR